MNHSDNPTPDELLAAQTEIDSIDTAATYLITDESGMPTAMVQPNLISDAGTRLAFRLAAAAGDRAAVNEVMVKTLARSGPDQFGYLCCNALNALTNDVLGPTLDVAEAAGVQLREGLARLAEGLDPQTGEPMLNIRTDR